MHSRLISASDRGRYNKSSTCRSCGYNHPSISSLRECTCDPFSLRRRGSIASLMLKVCTHHHYTRSFPIAIHHITTLAVPRAGPITILVVLCASQSNKSSIHTRSNLFLDLLTIPFRLLILMPEGFKPATHRYS